MRAHLLALASHRTVGASSRLLCLCVAALLPCCSGPEGSDASRLHAQAIVIDTHADTTPYFSDPTWHFDERHEAAETHVDLPRIREGGLDAVFWSIYLGEDERAPDGSYVPLALERIAAVRGMVGRHPDAVVLATRAEDIRSAARQGRFASLMGLEGGHLIDGNLAALRAYHALGVRYMTLTHSFHTSWADSSGTRTPLAPRHHGLTDFGKAVVREMNRLGMMVDVSHVSDETFWDVLEVSRAPVLASHSSTRAVADHVRNLDDEMLRALADRGGVVMLNFYPAYIDEGAAIDTRAWRERSQEDFDVLAERFAHDRHRLRRERRAFVAAHPPPSVALDVLLDHFDHAVAVAGPDHVGLGADWDGVPSMPFGMEDVSRLPALTRGLLLRGHSEDTVRKLLGENLLRVMQDVERVARELRQRT